jgi:hypothetical protein
MPEFAAAVASYDMREVEIELPDVDRPRLLVVGEPHGAEQTGRVVSTLMRRLGFDRLALEWPEDELAPIGCDPRRVTELPPDAESRSGEGRFSAGLFALARAQPRPPLLLDLSGDHGDDRTSWLHERLVRLANPHERTLALVGAGHAIAMHERGLPGLLLEYDGGVVFHRGEVALGTLQAAPLPRVRLEPARPALVAP